MTYAAPILGLLAGVAGIADTFPYVRDTVRGSTRSHRGTWLIWGVLAVIVCLSQRADGASWSLIVHGREKVPVCGQVEVPAGGQLKVPVPRSSCRPGG
jgi:hypothetical protein